MKGVWNWYEVLGPDYSSRCRGASICSDVQVLKSKYGLGKSVRGLGRYHWVMTEALTRWSGCV